MGHLKMLLLFARVHEAVACSPLHLWHASPFPCPLSAGHTSAALTRERPWLQAHLSTIASSIAIIVGILIGLAGLGVEVPFFS